jgi:DNA polymerase-3 subunit alpha
MTADMDVTDKLVILKDDCRQLGIRIEPPAINASYHGFTVGGAKRIRYGLGAVKGVGRNVVEALIAEREAEGPYRDLLDLCRRVGTHRLNRRVLEALTRAGALDAFGLNRPTLMAAIADTLRLAETAAAAVAAGQGALFGDAVDAPVLEHVIEAQRDWTRRERLDAEYESLGLFLTGHPFDTYADHCAYFTHGSIANVVGSLPEVVERWAARRDVILAGVVMDIRRRGNRLAVVLDDNTDRVEVTVFDEVYEKNRPLLEKHQVLVIDGQLRFDDFLNAWRLTAQRIRSVDAAIEEYARRITISLSGDDSGLELIGQLRETLAPFRQGACEVSIQYRSAAGEAQLVCSDEWSVRPTRELRESLSRLLGEDRYAIHYPKHIA